MSHVSDPDQFDPDDDAEDDEIEADLDPVAICRHCGSAECKGYCESVYGLNTP